MVPLPAMRLSIIEKRLLRRNNIWFPIFKRVIHAKTPFDLEDTDNEYKDLTSMYTDMFTADSIAKPVEKGSTESLEDDIDALNNEFNDLYSVGLNSLSGETLEQMTKASGRFIIKSLSNNPYYNLSLEDYVFRNTPVGCHSNFGSQRLLFYINDKCAVIGKNQTVWKELYLSRLKEHSYECIRRFSGGGAVIHDLGNVNYSFLTSREEFNRDFFNKCIVKWLLSTNPGLPLSLNERGDITWNDYKVSGSAFKIAKGKAYHHGTMLINSDIKQFSGLLKPREIPGVTWKCKSIDSVRSKIANLPMDSNDKFIDTCIQGFKSLSKSETEVYFCDEETTMNEEISKTMQNLMSHDWKYLSGPSFQVNVDQGNHSIKVEKGIIINSSILNTVGLTYKEFTDKSQEFLDTKTSSLFQ